MLRSTPSTLVSKVTAKLSAVLLGHRPGLSFGAGIVDRNVETAEPSDGTID
jgi:hypothetical protein